MSICCASAATAAIIKRKERNNLIIVVSFEAYKAICSVRRAAVVD